ncbi:ammonium transporter [Fontisphaera persica]|uniref:ammonium transporter n=1 Tax=Fontisphaera persica TaxID=2974023 RepID=UPI0024C046AD|nr:ammonium transporter [Fontisphaera persica]WCJ61042.1 ammonium transporter [Fontisphaera persica]
MKKIFLVLSLLGWLTLGGVVTAAGADAPAKPERSLAERIEDLEAYMNNVARGGNTNAPSKIPGPGPGHNAWQMTSTALVLFMTLPGLALFYGGLVRRKNVLSVMAQCLGIAGMSTVLWYICGYSLAFAPGNPFLGGFDFLFLKGVNGGEVGQGSNWISNNVWAMFQLTFAIITPALIVGAIAERMKFSALMLFMLGWMFLVYYPLAHMVWAADGLMCGPLNPNAKIKALDFAGGTVVHMSSGWSALVLCLILGKRLGFPKEPMPPHSMVLTMIGTGMLWVGWYGFNAGSALAADGIAANAFTTTTLAAATGGFVWGMAEYALKGKPSVLGFCSGIVAGLVVITPAAGFVTATGAMIIGVVAGIVPFLACWKLKSWLGYDDSLDTFGVHGVGGTLGALMTGILATPEANPVVESVKDGLLFAQIKAIVVTLVLSIVATAILAYIIKAVMGLRHSPEAETVGLDLTDHGEEGYYGRS